jgi:hypothetical protein
MGASYFLALKDRINHPDLSYAVSSSQDGNPAAPCSCGQDLDRGSPCLTFEGIPQKTPFGAPVKLILSMLESACYETFESLLTVVL